MTASSADSPPFRFYGAERSYFTGKARPALRAKRVYFEEILPTAEAYQEILRRTGMIFIPIVVTPEGETWQDSTEIYRLLEARHPEPPLFPSGALQRMAASRIRLCELSHPTPLAFPIMVNRLRSRVSSEKLADRIRRKQLRLEKAANRTRKAR